MSKDLLTQNFTYQEFVKSQTAERRGINNHPSPEDLENGIAVLENVVQPIRDHFGPTIITSGYRSPILNAEIGGSDTSQHQTGEAVDLEVPGVPTGDVAQWVADNLVFDQLILEFYTPGEVNSGWVHVSYKRSGKNRNEILTAARVSGRTEYTWGLNY